MIISISGRMGAGKDTVAQMTQYLWLNRQRLYDGTFEDFQAENRFRYRPAWTIKKFAGTLKEISGLLLGIDADQFEDQAFKHSTLGEEWSGMTVREFLQRLGTDAIRNNFHQDTWVNALFVNYDESCNWIITDCRFPNELNAVRRKGGKTILVLRGDPKPDEHISESALDGERFDYTIHNDGSLLQLQKSVDAILRHEQII